uniref:Uncharacterized protein n=1 Tax=Pyxicephalus adspersus TaxID=30357 RepID=A0AAV3AEW9_PYXAD|nr:TPA: hypothetical protein GDO54_005946 [Pyxicephalus adspersus]
MFPVMFKIYAPPCAYDQLKNVVTLKSRKKYSLLFTAVNFFSANVTFHFVYRICFQANNSAKTLPFPNCYVMLAIRCFVTILQHMADSN